MAQSPHFRTERSADFAPGFRHQYVIVLKTLTLATQSAIHAQVDAKQEDARGENKAVATKQREARMIAGAGDYTPSYLNGRVVSRSFQLALGVVFYSPLQYLHWYDQADRYSGRIYPELEFWKEMPTTWDDSKVVHGSIGSYMTVARRKGDRWFVGTIVNEARSLDIPLDFLGPGEFTATIYAENPNDKKLVSINSRQVTSNSSLTTTMSSGSGCAILISPTLTSAL